MKLLLILAIAAFAASDAHAGMYDRNDPDYQDAWQEEESVDQAQMDKAYAEDAYNNGDRYSAQEWSEKANREAGY